MTGLYQPGSAAWPLWRKLLFRFFFIYLVLKISPWSWLYDFPIVAFLNRLYNSATDWAVETANAKLFHLREVLVPINGSGDTSYGWVHFWLLLLVSLGGALIWSVL